MTHRDPSGRSERPGARIYEFPTGEDRQNLADRVRRKLGKAAHYVSFEEIFARFPPEDRPAFLRGVGKKAVTPHLKLVPTPGADIISLDDYRRQKETPPDQPA